MLPRAARHRQPLLREQGLKAPVDLWEAHRLEAQVRRPLLAPAAFLAG